MKNQTETVELDLFFLMKKLWQKKFLISFTAMLFATVTLLVSMFLIKPIYTAKTSFYVGNQKQQGEMITAQDLQAGDYLAKDYKEIIFSKDVRQQVIEDEKLSITADDLLNKMRVDLPVNTRILNIYASDSDAKEAARLANALRVAASEKIKLVTKVDNVNEVDPAEAPTSPSSPNIKRNTLIAFLLGGMVAVVTVLLVEVLDDRVKRAEDIEEVLGYPLLGVVPHADKMKF